MGCHCDRFRGSLIFPSFTYDIEWQLWLSSSWKLGGLRCARGAERITPLLKRGSFFEVLIFGAQVPTSPLSCN